MSYYNYKSVPDRREALILHTEILLLVVPQSTSDAVFIENRVDILKPSQPVLACRKVYRPVFSAVKRNIIRLRLSDGRCKYKIS